MIRFRSGIFVGIPETIRLFPVEWLSQKVNLKCSHSSHRREGLREWVLPAQFPGLACVYSFISPSFSLLFHKTKNFLYFLFKPAWVESLSFTTPKFLTDTLLKCYLLKKTFLHLPAGSGVSFRFLHIVKDTNFKVRDLTYSDHRACLEMGMWPMDRPVAVSSRILLELLKKRNSFSVALLD